MLKCSASILISKHLMVFQPVPKASEKASRIFPVRKFRVRIIPVRKFRPRNFSVRKFRARVISVRKFRAALLAIDTAMHRRTRLFVRIGWLCSIQLLLCTGMTDTWKPSDDNNIPLGTVLFTQHHRRHTKFCITATSVAVTEGLLFTAQADVSVTTGFLFV